MTRTEPAVAGQADTEGEFGWVVAVDFTVVCAHQHVAAAVEWGPGRRAGRPCPRTIPRGLTTKIHLAADSRCRHLACILTPGQSRDVPAFEHVIAGI